MCSLNAKLVDSHRLGMRKKIICFSECLILTVAWWVPHDTEWASGQFGHFHPLQDIDPDTPLHAGLIAAVM